MPRTVRPRSTPLAPLAHLVLPLAVASALLVGCAGTLETLRAAYEFESAALPAEQMSLDRPYREDADADPDKHALDLFLPKAADGRSSTGERSEGWPTIVFVHGGGWTHGDRAYGLFGIDPYRNIGRFFASRGYGVVVPSYRLQPSANWREQVADVAAAVAWARAEVARHGGDPSRIHLAGHSAGAWLAAWVGFNEAALAEQGLDRDFVCSLVLLSGAGYDPEDAGTYALGASPSYFEERFSIESEASEATDARDWARAASIRRHIESPAPPALVLNAGGEAKTFARQADLLFESLAPLAPASRRLEIPGLDHQRIVVEMSRPGSAVSDAVLDFLETADCGVAAS